MLTQKRIAQRLATQAVLHNAALAAFAATAVAGTQRAPKGMGGSAIGLLFGFQSVGGSIGPLVCGVMADQFGLMSTFYFMAVTIVIANMFVFIIAKPEAHTA